jgi:hypothetical protein
MGKGSLCPFAFIEAGGFETMKDLRVQGYGTMNFR